MFSKRAILSVIDLPSFGLGFRSILDGAVEFMGKEASRRGNGLSGLARG